MSDRLLLRLAPDGGLTWLRPSGAAAPGTSVAGAPSASVLAAARRMRSGRPQPERTVAVLADPVALWIGKPTRNPGAIVISS